jgi:hypothetical protein
MKHKWKMLQVDTNFNRKTWLGRHKRILKDNIKMYMEAGGCDDVDWIYLV